VPAGRCRAGIERSFPRPASPRFERQQRSRGPRDSRERRVLPHSSASPSSRIPRMRANGTEGATGMTVPKDGFTNTCPSSSQDFVAAPTMTRHRVDGGPRTGLGERKTVRRYTGKLIVEPSSTAQRSVVRRWNERKSVPCRTGSVRRAWLVGESSICTRFDSRAKHCLAAGHSACLHARQRKAMRNERERRYTRGRRLITDRSLLPRGQKERERRPNPPILSRGPTTCHRHGRPNERTRTKVNRAGAHAVQ